MNDQTQDENKLIAQRREKLSGIREFRNAYPNTFRRDSLAADLQEELGDKDKETLEATGGTNWKSYLPPGFQKIVFFPEAHDPETLANWGKQWVEHQLNPKKHG